MRPMTEKPTCKMITLYSKSVSNPFTSLATAPVGDAWWITGNECEQPFGLIQDYYDGWDELVVKEDAPEPPADLDPKAEDWWQSTVFRAIKSLDIDLFDSERRDIARAVVDLILPRLQQARLVPVDTAALGADQAVADSEPVHHGTHEGREMTDTQTQPAMPAWLNGCAETGRQISQQINQIQFDHERAAAALVNEFIYRRLTRS